MEIVAKVLPLVHMAALISPLEPSNMVSPPATCVLEAPGKLVHRTQSLTILPTNYIKHLLQY